LGAPHFLYYQLPFIEHWVRRNDFAHVGGIYQAWSPTYELPAERLEDAKSMFRAEGGPAGMLGFHRPLLLHRTRGRRSFSAA
jgi:hypothetical protein